MFLKLALAATIITGTAGVAQAADVSKEAAATPPAAEQAAKGRPYQMAGPVHIRLRSAADVNAALESSDPTVRKEAAYHAQADGRAFD
jgi:hypothetical protein